MKEFQLFVDSLSSDVRSQCDEAAMTFANEMTEKHKEEMSTILIPVIHERYYNYKMTLCLLEKYHEWLSE